MKGNLILNSFVFILLVLLLIVGGCNTDRKFYQQHKSVLDYNMTVWVVDEPIHLVEDKVIDKQVLILPGGYFKGTKEVKLVFKKPVVILSKEQVFKDGVNIEIMPGVMSLLNVTWWGANGMDDLDDTKAFQQVFGMATKLRSCEIEIPIGQYFINDQLHFEGLVGDHQSILISGVSTSYSGFNGSSLVWTGGRQTSMLRVANTSQTIFQNLEFNSHQESHLMTNIELRPSCNQIQFRNCTFSGCVGNGSSNVNINEGNNLQVSELTFDNCIFKGVLTDELHTDNAVRGGLANTKNFYFKNCSFGPYNKEAINIYTSDVLNVENCTFYLNDVDIRCETCKTIATANYSEESRAFFASTASANFNATTLINNQFTGKPEEGFVIRDGSGTLVLLNNNFGGGNYLEDKNRIRWEENDFNSIYSVGNVYKNATPDDLPFYNRNNSPYRQDRLRSFGDLGGMLGEKRIKLPDIGGN